MTLSDRVPGSHLVDQVCRDDLLAGLRVSSVSEQGLQPSRLYTPIDFNQFESHTRAGSEVLTASDRLMITPPAPQLTSPSSFSR
jgi:hypothetical protein